MEQIDDYNGVKYVPVKVLQDPEKKWISILAVPATSCDGERCFSSLKWVRDERQRDMKEAMHRAAVLLHYNGNLK